MGIRLFFIASFVYIALIFALAWYLELGNYTLSFSTYSFELPMMIWLILSLVPLVFFAIIHMGFYYFLLTLKFKHFFKDSTKFENSTRGLLLEKESNISFQTEEFRQVAQLAKTLKTHEKTPNANRINGVLDPIDGIKKEEYFNLNKFKLENNNILFLENERDHIKNDINYAYSKIKNFSQTQGEFQDLAFEGLIKKGTYEQIKNIETTKKLCHILALIKRFKEGNLELNAAEYEVLFSHNILSEKDYLDIAKLSIKPLNPSAVIGIFNKIKNEKCEVLRAYLYLLAEFGFLDEFRERIHNDDKKFNDFKVFLILREKNIKIDLDQFIQ